MNERPNANAAYPHIDTQIGPLHVQESEQALPGEFSPKLQRNH
jgi:hypothetical protein